MPASNHNWVCFECRFSIRQKKYTDHIPKCLECGRDCYCLGYKVEIPKRGERKRWNEIKEESDRRDLEMSALDDRQKVRRRHALEKEIVKLEAMEPNEGRKSHIKKLKRDLAKRMNRL